MWQAVQSLLIWHQSRKAIILSGLTFAEFQKHSLILQFLLCRLRKEILDHNGLYYVKFIKNNCDQYRNIPNKFSANDVVQANCQNGEVKLNGILMPSLGALANDWEGFTLEPGLNQIGFSYSDWVEDAYKPKVKVKYREVFL